MYVALSLSDKWKLTLWFEASASVCSDWTSQRQTTTTTLLYNDIATRPV